ncbi:ubiquitin-conjugating enzyme/RWD-like protein, partial [Dipodascopsis uninucleata]
YSLQELLIEYTNIKSHCPSGIYVSASPTTPQIWYGVIFPRKGPYAGGVFRFIIFFTHAYPDAMPVVKMVSNIRSHPLVDARTGEFDFSQVDEGTFRMNYTGRVLVGRVLSYMKRSFKRGGIDFVTNGGSRQIKTNKHLYDWDTFKLEADLDVAQSRATHKLYDEDENGDPYAGENGDIFGAPTNVFASEENTIRFVRLD